MIIESVHMKCMSMLNQPILKETFREIISCQNIFLNDLNYFDLKKSFLTFYVLKWYFSDRYFLN